MVATERAANTLSSWKEKGLISEQKHFGTLAYTAAHLCFG